VKKFNGKAKPPWIVKLVTHTKRNEHAEKRDGKAKQSPGGSF